jgi:hypothetical protein
MKTDAFLWLAALGVSMAAAVPGRSCPAACLLSSEIILDVPPKVCEIIGGLYTESSGDGGDLPLAPLPSGACCFEDGMCENLSEPDCFYAGGAWSGPGSDCGWIDCFGACCLFGDECERLTQVGCEAIPGAEFMGNGIGCESVVCRMAGACCLPDGSCSLLTYEECIDLAGGVYQGWRTACAEVVCIGACCFDDDSPCVDGLAWNACEAEPPDGLGGHFLGYGSTCEPDVVPALFEEQACSFVQSGQNREFAFGKFDHVSGLRQLERVRITIDVQVILGLILENRNDSPVLSDVYIDETVIADLSQDLTYFPPPFVLIDVAGFAVECSPPVLPAGAFCAFESPYLFPEDAPEHLELVREAAEGVDEFIAIGPSETFRIILNGLGIADYEEPGMAMLHQGPHQAEGKITVRYEYTALGACCFFDGSCEGEMTLDACAAAGGLCWHSLQMCADDLCPYCPADFDGDGDVDTADLLHLLGCWGTSCGDLNCDENTGTSDLMILLGAWGDCP